MKRELAVMVFFLLAVLSCRSGNIRVNVTFDQLSGLAREDRVIFESNEIGSVQAVQFNPDGSYTAQVEIDEGFVHAVTQYSQFSIISDPDRQGHKAVNVILARQGGTPLKNGATVAGAPAESNFFSQLQKDLESGFGYFKEMVEKIERDAQQYPESEEYKELKKSLEDLAAEIEQKEEQAREKIKRDWLPRIQRELDRLRELLKQYGREEELEPLEKEVEKIRRI